MSRDLGSLAVHKCTRSTLDDIPIVTCRIHDDATNGLAFSIVGNRYGEVGNAVDEVIGAVERIDYPQVAGVAVSLVGFFC